MKKSLALLLALAMVFSMCACGNSGSTPAATEAPAATEETPDAASLVSDAFIDPVNDWSQYNDLITAIKAETDFAKRTEMMHEAEDILMSNYCVVPISYYNDIYLLKDYVEGMYANLFGTKFFQNVKMNNGSDTFRLNLASEPDFLDPALNSSVDGACLAAASFSGLYTDNAEGKTEPACATGYEITEDGLNFTVTLKDGLKWSDGSDLTAKDFEYSFKRLACPDTAAPYGETVVGMIDGYKDAIGNPDADGNTTTDPDWDALNVHASEDGKTLTIQLSYPCSYFDKLCAFAAMSPVQQATVEANGDAWCTQPDTFVCNGPYMITDWVPSERIVLSKNPNYKGG